jgi:hypothetical protein
MEAARLPEAAGRLHFLDFFDSLLTADGEQLRKKFELDGTHLSPLYVTALEGTLRGH